MNRDLLKRVAFFLLLWAALDICVPGFCRTDEIDLPPLNTAMLSWQNVQGTAPSHSSQQADQDDCFCCCSHIVHARYSVTEQSSRAIRFNLILYVANPRDVSFSYFHPPRI
jgi:hypothetical protein